MIAGISANDFQFKLDDTKQSPAKPREGSAKKGEIQDRPARCRSRYIRAGPHRQVQRCFLDRISVFLTAVAVS